MLIYLAHLAVTLPMLYRRLQGWPHGGPEVDSDGHKLFTLGRFGFVVNLLAVVYGGLMVVNLAWPRAEVFNPDGTMPILQWAGPITIAAVVLVGVACFPRNRIHPKPVTDGDRLIRPTATTDATEESR